MAHLEDNVWNERDIETVGRGVNEDSCNLSAADARGKLAIALDR